MIPLIYVGYAVVTIVIALASVQAYQTTEAVWNAWKDPETLAPGGVNLGAIGGLALLGLGIALLSRRK